DLVARPATRPARAPLRGGRARLASSRPLRGCALQTRQQHHAAVSPPRGGRQNDPLGFGEFWRRHVRDPPEFAAQPAATTAAPLRRQRRRGGIPEKPSPRTTTLPLRSRQNASPFCDHLLALFARVECENACQGSRHAVHNRLVGGLSPPGPTTRF